MSAPATFDFTGRHALVTGGTSGIGAAIARGFAAAGATVTAVGLPPADGTPATPSPGVTLVEADVTAKGAIAGVVAGLERLDVVVACAGVIRRDDEHDPDVFAQVVDVNLTGTMRTFSECKARLEESGGTAVATASILTYVGGPRVPGYAASKGGIRQLVRSLAIAWAPTQVRVNAIAPGWIVTPLTEPLRAGPDGGAPTIARTPMARWGDPEDLVGPVLFLCSDAAAFITGEVLCVDGGFLAA